MELNDQELIRRQKLEELYKHGINPYPAEIWENTHSSEEILKGFPIDPEKFTEVSLAGRIMSVSSDE